MSAETVASAQTKHRQAASRIQTVINATLKRLFPSRRGPGDDPSEKDAVQAYMAENSAAIRAIPGVTSVRVETIPTSLYSSEKGVTVYYRMGTDPEQVRASLPKSVDGVLTAVVAD